MQGVLKNDGNALACPREYARICILGRSKDHLFVALLHLYILVKSEFDFLPGEVGSSITWVTFDEPRGSHIIGASLGRGLLGTAYNKAGE